MELETAARSTVDPIIIERLAWVGWPHGVPGPGEPPWPEFGAWQARHGLAATGVLDPATVAAIGSWRFCAQSGPMTVRAANPQGPGLGRTAFTYELKPLPATWSAMDVIGGFNQAFAALAAVTPIRFTQVVTGADLTFTFDGLQPGTPNPFNPNLDSVTSNGTIAFNPARSYTSVLPVPVGSIDIVAIVMHEVGHFLGLNHSTDSDAVMYPTSPMGRRGYGADDLELLHALYGGRVEPVPGWFGANPAGVDVAVLPGTAGPNLLVAHIDDVDGASQGYYRVGWGLDTNGVPTLGWSPIVKMGDPIGYSTAGLGVAVGAITGGPGLDLVMAWMDDPGGANTAFYRVGRDLDASGFNAKWPGPDVAVPGWYGDTTAGFAVALGDIDADGRAELILAWIDDADGENYIHIKIGRNADANGVYQNWSDHIQVPGSVGDASAGLGAALTDLRGNGRPDLVLFWVDDPNGENNGRVRIGWDLDPSGTPIGGWSDLIHLTGWWGWSTAEAGAAIASIRGFARPDLITVNLDDPAGEDHAHYRVLSPPLPAWQRIRPLAPVGSANTPATPTGPGPVDHLAAIAPLPVSPSTLDQDEQSDVLVVGLGLTGAARGPHPVVGVYWDKADLDESAGTDILDYWTRNVDRASRRRNSPLALAAVNQSTVDIFWIDTANRVATAMAVNVGQELSTTTQPWSAVRQLGAVARPATPAVAGSPITACTLDVGHVSVFVAGTSDQIVASHRTNGNWDPPADLTGGWPKPVTALTSVARQAAWMEVFWFDVEGAIWGAKTTPTGGWEPAQRLRPPLSARADSPLVAVARADDQVDLYWIARDSTVVTSWFHDLGSSIQPNGTGWAEPRRIDGGKRAAAGSGLAAIHAGNQRMHVFWEGIDEAEQAIVSSWWGPRADGAPVDWSPPFLVTDRRTIRTGSDLAAAARIPERVQVFFVDAAGNAALTWWGTRP